MFGKNPIRPRESDPLNLAVQSIFPTIQGEGPFAGQCATFIRLAGCNLACHFCDTEFESGMVRPPAPVEKIVERVLAMPSHVQRLVVITGGEPLRQNIALLVDMLLTYAGTKVQHVQIETAGTLWEQRLNRWVMSGELTIVCSPKTPGINPEIEQLCRHWKYIIRAGDVGPDGLPSRGTQTRNMHLEQQIWRRPGGWLPEDAIWLSPCDESQMSQRDDLTGPELTWRNTALVAKLAMEHGYRAGLQMHKYFGVE